MNITLDQGRALDALATHGTFMAAAKALGKQHSALVYAIKGLEDATGLELLDRTGYRTRLSSAGLRVLEECRRMLAVERDLEVACHEIQTGWEPLLRVVFDGIYPARRILREVASIAAPSSPTRVEVFAEFLAGVTETFERTGAHLMVSVLPPEQLRLAAIPLPALAALLVVHRDHPLARRKGVSIAELQLHPILTVRGSNPRLQLPTSSLEQRSTIHLNDFHTKKEAILAKMGFGWMPREMIEKELARGLLTKVRWERPSEHLFRPQIYHRADAALGRAARSVVRGLQDQAS